MSNRKYMELAIELAEKARGFTNPNPLVGAVIVKEDRIIGRGYHEKYGQLHAERNALASCTEDPKGAVMYVTLEPCCHYGKTPPCTEAIIAGGLSKVFIGSRDPNPLVSGKGVKMLQNAGIEVTTDFMKEECDALNPVFFHFIIHQTPYVVMKYAMTMDGKMPPLREHQNGLLVKKRGKMCIETGITMRPSWRAKGQSSKTIPC